MGLVVENYSKFYLTNPVTSGSNVCSSNKEVRNVKKIDCEQLA